MYRLYLEIRNNILPHFQRDMFFWGSLFQTDRIVYQFDCIVSQGSHTTRLSNRIPDRKNQPELKNSVYSRKKLINQNYTKKPWTLHFRYRKLGWIATLFDFQRLLHDCKLRKYLEYLVSKLGSWSLLSDGVVSFNPRVPLHT